MRIKLEEYRDLAVQRIFPDKRDADLEVAVLRDNLYRLKPSQKQEAHEIHRQIFQTNLKRYGILHTLPTDPLRQRNEEGHPVFVPFALFRQWALFCLKMRCIGWDTRFLGSAARHAFFIDEPITLPSALRRQYADMESHLRKRIPLSKFRELPLGEEVIMSTRYDGLIPDVPLHKIQSVASLFGNQVYLISEVDKWNYGSTSPRGHQTQRTDTLVVGYAYNELYLITSFDHDDSKEFLFTNSVIAY